MLGVTCDTRDTASLFEPNDGFRGENDDGKAELCPVGCHPGCPVACHPGCPVVCSMGVVCGVMQATTRAVRWTVTRAVR